jgi:hypothetical protein
LASIVNLEHHTFTNAAASGCSVEITGCVAKYGSLRTRSVGLGVKLMQCNKSLGFR